MTRSRKPSSAPLLCVLRPARALLRHFNHLHEDSTTYREDPGLCGLFPEVCSIPNDGIWVSMRVVRRVERYFGRRIRRTAAELRGRLPGLLQAECAARGV